VGLAVRGVVVPVPCWVPITPWPRTWPRARAPDTAWRWEPPARAGAWWRAVPGRLAVVAMWARRRATPLGGGVTLTTCRAGPVEVFAPGHPRKAMIALAAANTRAAPSANAPAVPIPARYARVARTALSIGVPGENLSPRS